MRYPILQLANPKLANPMERALQAMILRREPRSRVRETPMPRRAHSSGSTMFGVVCALLATVAVGIDSPAQAECIAQPNQQAPEGAHWSLHYDRAKNRRCWILVDATGHDISTPPAQPDTSPALSAFQTFIGNFTGGPPSPPAQEAAAASPATATQQPRRPPARVASPNRAERAVRTEQRETGDAQAGKRELTEPEREALFEEFLRWHESQQIMGTVNPSPR
jgi:hypothetical protein